MKHVKLVTTPEVSKRMKAQSKKKSFIEVEFAKKLWHRGLRYRLNYKKLPGSPDIVLTKYKIVIFIDGEFWHGKNFTVESNNIKNNHDYWSEKISENINRDRRNDLLLSREGWKVLHFWSKEAIGEFEKCYQKILEEINKIIPTPF